MLNEYEKQDKQLRSVIDSMKIIHDQHTVQLKGLLEENNKLIVQQQKTTKELQDLNNNIKPAIKREIPVWLKVLERIGWVAVGIFTNKHL